MLILKNATKEIIILPLAKNIDSSGTIVVVICRRVRVRVCVFVQLQVRVRVSTILRLTCGILCKRLLMPLPFMRTAYNVSLFPQWGYHNEHQLHMLLHISLHICIET